MNFICLMCVCGKIRSYPFFEQFDLTLSPPYHCSLGIRFGGEFLCELPTIYQPHFNLPPISSSDHKSLFLFINVAKMTYLITFQSRISHCINLIYCDKNYVNVSLVINNLYYDQKYSMQGRNYLFIEN